MNMISQVVISWLIPGYGLVARGKKWQGYTLGGISLIFVLLGWIMGGFYYPLMSAGVIDRLLGVLSAGNGLAAILFHFVIHTEHDPSQWSYAIGCAYFILGGMSNWMLVIDELDLAKKGHNETNKSRIKKSKGSSWPFSLYPKLK